MSTIDGMAQLYLGSYSAGASGSGAQTSGIDSALSDLLSTGNTAGGGVSTEEILSQAEQAITVDDSNQAQQLNQTNALVQFYNDASSLNQAAAQLSPSAYSDDGSAALTESNIDNFVSAYNSIVSDANGSQRYISPDALDGLTQGFEDEAGNLQTIGITQNSDGTLSIDEDTLNSAIENDPDAVASALTGADGLASNTVSATQDILNKPLSRYAAALSPQNNNGADFYSIASAINASDSFSTFLGQMMNTKG